MKRSSVVNVTVTMTNDPFSGCAISRPVTYNSHTYPGDGTGDESGSESGSSAGESEENPPYGGGGGGSSSAVAVAAPKITINLAQRLDCFSFLSSNNNTIYTMTLHVDRTTNYLSNPGHTYITLEKSNGDNLQRLSYGFYPETNNPFIIGMSNPINSAIGEESGDPNRESDIRYSINVSATSFQNAIMTSLSLASNDYDINDYNCAHYAIDVFNTALGPGNQLNSTSTPNGLYDILNSMSGSGIGRDKINKGSLPPSTGCN